MSTAEGKRVGKDFKQLQTRIAHIAEQVPAQVVSSTGLMQFDETEATPSTLTGSLMLSSSDSESLMLLADTLLADLTVDMTDAFNKLIKEEKL